MAMLNKIKGYPQPWSEGDLVEYMRDFRPNRPKFGIIIGVKKIVGSYELEVLWGSHRGWIDAKLVEKR